MTPGITAEQAIAAAQSQFGEGKQASAVYAAFGLFTDANYGPVSGEEGPVSPTYVNVPAWIVTYAGLSMPPAGAYPAPPSPRVNTELNVVIDATTGAYMLAFSWR